MNPNTLLYNIKKKHKQVLFITKETSDLKTARNITIITFT